MVVQYDSNQRNLFLQISAHGIHSCFVLFCSRTFWIIYLEKNSTWYNTTTVHSPTHAMISKISTYMEDKPASIQLHNTYFIVAYNAYMNQEFSTRFCTYGWDTCSSLDFKIDIPGCSWNWKSTGCIRPSLFGNYSHGSSQPPLCPSKHCVLSKCDGSWLWLHEIFHNKETIHSIYLQYLHTFFPISS